MEKKIQKNSKKVTNLPSIYLQYGGFNPNPIKTYANTEFWTGQHDQPAGNGQIKDVKICDLSYSA